MGTFPLDHKGRPIAVGDLVVQAFHDDGKGAIRALTGERGSVAELGRSRAGVRFDTLGPDGPLRRVHGSALEILGRSAEIAYPEHVKLSEVKDATQAVGEFMDFVGERGIFLARYPEDSPHHATPIFGPLEDLLAEWAGIDRDRIEQEKLAMLEAMRAPLDES